MSTVHALREIEAFGSPSACCSHYVMRNPELLRGTDGATKGRLTITDCGMAAAMPLPQHSVSAPTSHTMYRQAAPEITQLAMYSQAAPVQQPQRVYSATAAAAGDIMHDSNRGITPQEARRARLQQQGKGGRRKGKGKGKGKGGMESC